MAEHPLFTATGPLAKTLPGWESRPPQTAMAEAVERALDRGENLVVEAGTGVGKSLAYLLPAALWAVRGARRVLISTHTRALQEQLLRGELPLVAKILADMGLPLKFSMLMGADNYLCVQRLGRMLAQPSFAGDADYAAATVLDRWSREAKSGHRSALPEPVDQHLWDRLARDSEVCLGPGGPYWERCLWRLDKERAEKAHLLVVNHSLLLSGARLPSYDAMILDEAHNLEDAASARFGCEVSIARIVALAEETRLVSRLGGNDALLETADRAQAAGAKFLTDLAKGLGLSRAEEEAPGQLLGDAGEDPPPELARLETALAAASVAAEGRAEEPDLRSLHSRAAQLGHDLRQILAPAASMARWASWPRTGPELRCAPLDTGKRLSETLFGRGIPAILTSATLSGSEELSDSRRRLGVGEARELRLESPFDYRAQAGLWFADDLPLPSADEAVLVKALSKRCAEIIARVPGGVFLLFSSWRTLKAVHTVLRKKIKNRPVWAQGAAGSEELLEQFAAAGNAVLLGVDTFWQGVDVPGPALSCVVLAKLPFPNPHSPLEQARRRYLESEGLEYFHDWSLPKAVMKFRQGFGRLIRSGSDRGAVVCLDPRLVKKGYGKVFREALPSCKTLESLEDLAAFFAPASTI